MPAFTQPQRGLTVVLYCDGHERLEVTAGDPQHAAVVALGLISVRGALNAGDRLIVTRADDDPPELPEVSRAAHYS
jgi:hypothetical protein